MTKIDLMVFDFDGTLVSSGNDLAVAVNHMLEILGNAALPKERIIGFVGDGVRKLIERSLGDAFPDRFDEALNIFMSYYGEHMMDTTELYPGVLEVLNHFRSKRKAIVTNKLYNYTLKIADKLNIKEYFDDIIGMDSNSYKKPDARIIHPLIDKYRVEGSCTVVIGDGTNDIILAKNAGVLSCALLNGLGNRDKLLQLKPDYFCENIMELKNLFV